MTLTLKWQAQSIDISLDNYWYHAIDGTRLKTEAQVGGGMNLFTRDSHYKKKKVAWKWVSEGAINYARNIISWNTFLQLKLEEQAKDNAMTACRFLNEKKKGKNGDSLVQRININCRRNTSRGILLLKILHPGIWILFYFSVNLKILTYDF